RGRGPRSRRARPDGRLQRLRARPARTLPARDRRAVPAPPRAHADGVPRLVLRPQFRRRAQAGGAEAPARPRVDAAPRHGAARRGAPRGHPRGVRERALPQQCRGDRPGARGSPPERARNAAAGGSARERQSHPHAARLRDRADPQRRDPERRAVRKAAGRGAGADPPGDHARGREDLLANAPLFRPPELPMGAPPMPFPVPGMRGAPGHDAALRRYAVNVVVDHSVDRGAPIVYEQHPSLQNLVGRIEHRAQFGALITDFTMIRPGALHRANGGYLVLDADRVLSEPFAWTALKRALFAKEIRIETAGEMLSLVSTVSLEPQPIPLDLKIVLIGER